MLFVEKIVTESIYPGSALRFAVLSDGQRVQAHYTGTGELAAVGDGVELCRVELTREYTEIRLARRIAVCFNQRGTDTAAFYASLNSAAL
jgi:hypothetical protein